MAWCADDIDEAGAALVDNELRRERSEVRVSSDAGGMIEKMMQGAHKQLTFFFFQAEDGIRDLTVTGVQTCALPISLPGNPLRRPARRRVALAAAPASRALGRRAGRHRPGQSVRPGRRRDPRRPDRSEERRVGKECRSRWSPYH